MSLPTATVARDGVTVAWRSQGWGEPALLLMPPWSIVHSRCWKLQVPDFARRHRVITFDPRGNGGSGRPADAASYFEDAFAGDALAVLDAAGVDRAVVIGFSRGAQRSLILAGEQPDRVAGLVLVAPVLPLRGTSEQEREAARRFHEDRGSDHGWERFNAHSWRRDFPGFLEFFFAQMFPEPHSTKQIEDCVGWGLETDAETLIAAEVPGIEPDRARELCATLTCPLLVIHGDTDAIVPYRVGVEAARLTGAPLVTFAGSGHCPQARDPVRFNLTLRAFIAGESRQPATWTRARSRRPRALYISSPIGLGHARRDVAIADRLRQLRPDLEIDWLAQHPVTAVLEQRGERIHPASAELASESDHIQSEATEHRLHIFQALRRMDEILLANFMVFHDVAQAGDYDVWIADEAWDVDYYLHENPELKSAAYVWLSDFVGYLPMPSGGEREAFLTADDNANMLEQLGRFPRVRDAAIFIGEPDDIVPDRFGPGLPSIREWTREHFAFAGYVTGTDQADVADRESTRRELGYAPDERICVVTVGGSGVGSALLRRAIDSFEPARQLVPGLRMVVVAGPRIDLATLPAPDGIEIQAYVHDLHRHLAACDLAIVQGGLATVMELTASRTPFLSFPLQDHFEQRFHVDHRLRRHRAGRPMEFDASPPPVIAAAIAEEIGRPVDYLPVPRDGASRAAAMIAALL